MLFWTDGHTNSTRERNVKLTWPYLKRMVKYLNTQNIPTTATLYDYSPEKIVDDAVHIVYPLGTYKRAEKINKIIHELPVNDYVCIVDSDMFIHHSQWNTLERLTYHMRDDIGYFFNWAKLDSVPDCQNLDNISLECPHTLAFIKGYTGGFGGIYLTSVHSIKAAGGYSEKFTTWGGEDGDLMDRWYYKFTKIGITEEELLPFHLPHFTDSENILYFNREEYVRNNFT